LYILRISVSAALLIFLFHKIRPAALWEIVRESNKPLLLSALVLTVCGYVLCYFRWRMLLSLAGVRVSSARVLSAYGGGLFFGILLPSTIGPDLVRSLDLAARTKKASETVATVLLDRLSGFTGMVLVAITALILGARLIPDARIVGVIIMFSAALGCILVVIFNSRAYGSIKKLLHREQSGRIRSALASVHRHMHQLRAHRAKIAQNLALSVSVQLLSPLAAWLVALAFGVRIPLIYMFIFFPVITAVTMLPLSIGGLGLRDYTAVMLFAQVGVSANISFAVSLAIFAFTVACSALGGLIYVFTIHNRRI